MQDKVISSKFVGLVWGFLQRRMEKVPRDAAGSPEIKTESPGRGGSQSLSVGQGLFVLFCGGVKDGGGGRVQAVGGCGWWEMGQRWGG